MNGGAYVGGVMAAMTNGCIDAKRMSKITGYSYTGGIATFQFETKPSMQPPFPGGKPNANEIVYIMAADPFDSRDVYPRSGTPITEAPSFAMYPLVFSAGSDGYFGIVCDFGGGLQYSANGMIPVSFDASNQMIGTEKAVASDPQNSWLDNITSHDLNKK
jgi:hypothetical protein